MKAALPPKSSAGGYRPDIRDHRDFLGSRIGVDLRNQYRRSVLDDAPCCNPLALRSGVNCLPHASRNREPAL